MRNLYEAFDLNNPRFIHRMIRKGRTARAWSEWKWGTGPRLSVSRANKHHPKEFARHKPTRNAVRTRRFPYISENSTLQLTE